MKRILLALLPLFLAACADAPPKQTVAAAPTADVVCEVDAATGTNFPKKRCRTEAQRADEKTQVRDMQDNVRAGMGDVKGR